MGRLSYLIWRLFCLISSQCATLVEDCVLSDEENVLPGEEAVLYDE
jgi:hypothetical protein